MRKPEYDQIKEVLTGVRKITDANERFRFKSKEYSLNEDNRVCQRKTIITNMYGSQGR